MIAGMMAICDSPLSTAMAVKLSQHVDYLVLRYDVLRGYKENGIGGKLYYELLRRLEPFSIPVDHYETEKMHKGGFGWREEMLRRLDHIKPDYVCCVDSDECFHGNFEQDFERFTKSKADFLLFPYEMVSDDGRKVPQSPKQPHCKVFRWVPGLTFIGAPGFGVPLFPYQPIRKLVAKYPMYHYSFFTKEMEHERLRWYARYKKPAHIESMFRDGGIEEKWPEWYENNYWQARGSDGPAS